MGSFARKSTMNEKIRTVEEQAVLDAAQALGTVQLAELRHIRRLKAADEHKLLTATQLEDAEVELAAADVAYASVNYTVLLLKQRLRNLDPVALEAYIARDRSRELLWTVASSPDQDLILRAAESYGECSRIRARHAQEERCLKEELAAAQEALRVAGQTRKLVVQKRGKAKAEAESAAAAATQCRDEYGRRFYNSFGSEGSFGAEGNLVDAAHVLTGTFDLRTAYSFTETSSLPIQLPEDGACEPAVDKSKVAEPAADDSSPQATDDFTTGTAT
jgi:hypothetical protein